MSTYTLNNKEISALYPFKVATQQVVMNASCNPEKLVTVLVENMETSKYTLHACLATQSCLALWTVACQAPLARAFPKSEYWSELQFSSSRDFSRPRDTNHISYVSCIAGEFLTH